MKPWLGVIADDYTGATDLAGMLVRSGVSTVQFLGVPAGKEPSPEAECLVVALKSRSIDPDEAVRQSVDAAKWLLAQGVDQVFFKYCSTFDSTADGNIGPVAEALARSAEELQVWVEATRQVRAQGLDLDHAVAAVVERTAERYRHLADDPAVAHKQQALSSDAANITGIWRYLEKTEPLA